MLLGGFATVIGFLEHQGDTQEALSSEMEARPLVDSTALWAAGPLRFPKALDLGYPYGLPNGALVIKPERYEIAAELTQFLAVRGALPSAAEAPAVAPILAEAAAHPLLRLEVPQQRFLAWRDDYLREGTPDAAAARALSQFVTVLQAQETLRAYVDDHHGGPNAVHGILLDLATGGALAPGGHEELAALAVAEPVQEAARQVLLLRALTDAAAGALAPLTEARRAAAILGLPYLPAADVGPQRLADSARLDVEAGVYDRATDALLRSLRRGGLAPPIPVVNERSDLSQAVQDYAEARQRPLSGVELEELDQYASLLSYPEATLLATIIGAAADAEADIVEAYGHLTQDDIALLLEIYDLMRKNPEGAQTWREVARRVPELEGRFDLTPLIEGNLHVVAATERAVENYRAQQQAGGGAPVLEFPKASSQPPGAHTQLISIGSTKAETFREDAALVIDFGGDDLYEATVGGGGSLGALGLEGFGRGFVHLLVDLGGDDVYQPKLSFLTNAALGGANPGTTSIMLDFAGDDTYAPYSGEDFQIFGYTFGGTGLGVATAVDYAGDDVYRMDNLWTHGSGTLGYGFAMDLAGDDLHLGQYQGYGFGALGYGEFLEAGGDDEYSMSGQGLGYGALATGLFHDFVGDDVYDFSGTGLGFSALGFGLFTDAGGHDQYPNPPAVADPEPADDTVWVSSADSVNVGVGIDHGSDAPPVPGLDLSVKFLSPSPRFRVAPGAAMQFKVLVENRGDVDSPAGRVVLEVTPRDDNSASSSFTSNPVMVNVGALPAGGRAVVAIPWTAPNTAPTPPRLAEAFVQIVSPTDLDSTNDLDTLDFSIEVRPDVRIDAVRITESGRVTPSTTFPALITLSNQGNADVGATVLLQIQGADEDTAGYAVEEFIPFTLPAPSAVYDPSLAPTVLTLQYNWTSPSILGLYNANVSLPQDRSITYQCADSSSQGCQDATFNHQELSIEFGVDAKVEAKGYRSYTDPDFFQGFQWRIANGGADPLTGTLNLTARLFPYGTIYPETVSLSLASDTSTIITQALPPVPLLSGDTWEFTATAYSPYEAPENMADNVASHKVTFRGGVVLFEPFDEASPSWVARSLSPCPEADPLWQRGVPSYSGVIGSGLASPPVGVTGGALYGTYLHGPVCDASRHDLVLEDVDLTGLLSPITLEFWTAIDSFGYPGEFGFSGGYVAVSPAGADEFASVEPAEGYDCPTSDLSPFSEDTGEAIFCGTFSWRKRTLDLSEYAGQTVDVRFRYVSYSCCYNAEAAGWFVDDVTLLASRRIDGDAEILELRTAPSPLIAGEASSVEMVVRNNGNTTLGVTGSVVLAVGTTSSLLPLPLASIPALEGGQTVTLAFPFTPPSAKRFSIQRADISVQGAEDPVLSNNMADVAFLEAFDKLGGSDLEELTSCPGECGGWTHLASPASGPAEAPDEWELGTPLDFPESARSGTKAWSTDLDGPYERGRASPVIPDGGYGTARYYKLTSPGFEASVEEIVEGDEFALSFQHAYWLMRQETSDPWGYTNQDDFAYVVARNQVTGGTRFLTPEGGYPESAGRAACFPWEEYESECGDPPVNGLNVGWSGKSRGWTPAVMDVPNVNRGDVYEFHFYLYSQFRSDKLGQARPGWSIDDVFMLRKPRFDFDLLLRDVSPTFFNATQPNTAFARVSNLGRESYGSTDPVQGRVVLTLYTAGAPMEFTVPLPDIERGHTETVPIPFVAPPNHVGPLDMQARVEWGRDEWNVNDVTPIIPARFAWLFHNGDFEQSNGGWKTFGALALKYGTPPGREALQGARSWYTGSLAGSEQGGLEAPLIPLVSDTGVRMKSVTFESMIFFDGGTHGLICPYNGFRWSDVKTGKVMVMDNAPYVDLDYWAIQAHCGDFRPIQATFDLTNRQETLPQFQPRFEGWAAYYPWCTCFIEPSNRGMEIDAVNVYGQPFEVNLQLDTFLSPGSLVGPGLDAPVSVRVINGGLKWPSFPVGVEFLSSDASGDNGQPSLSKVRVLPEYDFAESQTVSTTWRVPNDLDGKSVSVSARLVMLSGTSWIPLTDEWTLDNAIDTPVAVLSIHDLSVKVSARPSLVPSQATATLVHVDVQNVGTLREGDVRTEIDILDEDGQVLYHHPGFFDALVAPSYVEAAKTHEFAWLAPAAGHYQVLARLEYDDAAFDLTPLDNEAKAWVHLGTLPYRAGDSFDEASTGWTAEGGVLSLQGFRQGYAADAPEGASVLRSNPTMATYEPDARYRYELGADLAGAAQPRLTFLQAYDLGDGDAVRVLASEDRGATWSLLHPVGGYLNDPAVALVGYQGRSDGWRSSEFDLAAYMSKDIRLRFELAADAVAEGPGWRLDAIRVLDGSVARVEETFESDRGQVVQHWDFEGGDQGWDAAAVPDGMNDFQRGRPTFGVPSAYMGLNAWKTNLTGTYSTPGAGHKYLRSPVFQVPADKEAVTLTWYQFHQTEWIQFYWDPAPWADYSDAILLRLSVDGGPEEVVEPDGGYPAAIYEGAHGNKRGFAGDSGGWQLKTLDLTAYAGSEVQLIWDLSILYGDLDWPRYEAATGKKGGLAIDEVTLFARDAVAPYVNPKNARLEGIDVGLISTFEPSDFAITVTNEDATERVGILSWRWIGPLGRVLQESSEAVTLAPGIQSFPYTLDALDEDQPAILWARVDVSGDDEPGDNEATVDASLFDVLLEDTFEAPPDGYDGAWPCVEVSPCGLWSHSGDFDEWHHDAVPIDRHPFTTFEGSYAYGTDLSLVVGDGDYLYSPGARESLFSPQLSVPSEGAMLRFQHALDAPPWDIDPINSLYDAAQVYVGGELLVPEGGFEPAARTGGNCGEWEANYGPCYWGTFDWRPAEFSLDGFKGQDIELEFRLSADPWMNQGQGWTLDDLQIVARTPTPTTDVGVVVPPLVRADPRYPLEYEALVTNEGLKTTSLLVLKTDWFRDDRLVHQDWATVPTLKPGESRTLPLAVPGGGLEALRAVVQLEGRTGGAPDHDPTNDRGESRFTSFHSLFSADFEDGRVPLQSDRVFQPQLFKVGRPVADVEGAPSANVLVTGFGIAPLSQTRHCVPAVDAASGCNFLVMGPFTIPSGATFEFDHFYRFTGGEGAALEYSVDGFRWMRLEPVGGYPDINCATGHGNYNYPCWRGSLAKWDHVVVPLDGIAGQTVELRLRYFRSPQTGIGAGWALDNLVLQAPAAVEAFRGESRFERDRIQNPGGPIEAVSYPNAWGTGMRNSTLVPGARDVVESPLFDLSRMPRPNVAFDYWMAPSPVGSGIVWAQDAGGNWIEMGRLADTEGLWSRAQFSLDDLGPSTRVRVTYAESVLEYGFLENVPAGLFIDDVLVGSLSADVERVEDLGRIEATDGANLTIPVVVTNTGAFTNLYTVSVRGVDPTWLGSSLPPSVQLEPGESRIIQAVVQIPFGGDPGEYDVMVVAQSLFDPLDRAMERVPLKVKTGDRPDWEVLTMSLMSFALVDGAWTVPDATPNHLVVTIQNKGTKDSDQPARVVFYEHRNLPDGGTERRALNTTYLEARPASVPVDTPYVLNMSWMPRKSVFGFEVVVNPGRELPETSIVNNSAFQRLVVVPRPLPELELGDEPTYTRQPHVKVPVVAGINVYNSGVSATDIPVDVALLAGYRDAYLESPVLTLPGRDVLRLQYASDLEVRIDGVVLEARPEGGSWSRLVPIGDYTHGCILALECASGISGTTSSRVRELKFDLRPYVGPTQFRLQFGMDSHNGRAYDGFQLVRVSVHHFLDVVKDFNFAKGANGWTPTHTWTYRTPQGSLTGAWIIPRDYQNPFTVALRQIPLGGACPPCLGAGTTGFAEMDWTPQVAGPTSLIVYIDPHDAQPEFSDDYNRFEFEQDIHSSAFYAEPLTPVVLANASASNTFTLRLTNAGNHAGQFDFALRPHPHFEFGISRYGRAIDHATLNPGQRLEVDLYVRARGAPAGMHHLQLDVEDEATFTSFALSIPVDVRTGFALPDLEAAQLFDVRQSARQTLQVRNVGNAYLEGVVLRVAEKPTGLAARITPAEFSLAPFEARAVEFEFLNLGATPGSYSVPVINARVVCPADAADCNRMGALNVRVQAYEPPRAVIDLGRASANLAEPVKFEDGSTSVGSQIVAWKWDFGDGATSTNQNPTHAYAKPGVYRVTLKVVDAEGQSQLSAPTLLPVVNREPVTVARVGLPEGGHGRVGVAVNFTAEDSIDVDGHIQAITWAFGDGALATGLNATHSYLRAGTYRVTVAVEDSFGAVSIQVLSVTIDEAPAGAQDVAEDEGEGSPAAGLLASVALLGLVAWFRRRRTSP